MIRCRTSALTIKSAVPTAAIFSFHRGNPAAYAEGEHHENHPVIYGNRAVAGRVGGGAAHAQSTGPTIHNRVTSDQTASPTINVPTVVINITQALPIPATSQASYQLYNGGNAVSMDASGNLTVSTPTDIRIMINGANGAAYSPVGVSFQQTDTTDSNGASNLSQSVANQTLVIHDSDQIPGTNYVYQIVFEGPDGQLHTLGH